MNRIFNISNQVNKVFGLWFLYVFIRLLDPEKTLNLNGKVAFYAISAIGFINVLGLGLIFQFFVTKGFTPKNNWSLIFLALAILIIIHELFFVTFTIDQYFNLLILILRRLIA